MRSLATIIILLLTSLTLTAQQQASVWYFGHEAGIDFSSGTPVSLTDGNMIAEAGCSAVCDAQGMLQFYTNGMQVWNRNHQIMENGDSLYGSQYINQNSVIVPRPLSDDSVYYLFTINQSDSNSRFSYSEINMNRANGLGKLTARNDTLSRDVLEKIAAVQHCNGQDFWIVTHDFNTNFYSVLVTRNGVADIVTSTTGMKIKADIGYLKVSPAGDKLVLPVNNEEVLAQIFDFDNKTGTVSNPVTLYRKADNTYCFGVEFSPDANMLYMTTGGKKFEIWQYDLRIRSEQKLNSRAIHITTGNNFAMQLAPDNKIYIARENSSYLNVIHKPNETGTACNYEAKALKLLYGSCFKGLPNFMQSWFYRPSFDVWNACYGDSTTFVFNQTRNIDSITWNFNPGEGNPVIGGNNFSVSRKFEDTITYTVSLSAYHCDLPLQISQQVYVAPYPTPVLATDTILYPNQSIVLDPGKADVYLWNTGSTSRFIQVSETGLYKVVMKNDECAVADSIQVLRYAEEVNLPNAFTPNNDGLNDLFKVVTTAPLYNFSMQIYDRNGMLVYQSNDFSQGWDGNYQGTPCPISTYVWYLKYDSYQDNGTLSHRTRHGFITLVR